jgi:hypothetical protein
MQSDPWWSFAMAVNVFLVFFFGANPSSFRRHLWLYCLVCFGAPAVAAVTCLLIQNDQLGKVYGDATVRGTNGLGVAAEKRACRADVVVAALVLDRS